MRNGWNLKQAEHLRQSVACRSWGPRRTLFGAACPAGPAFRYELVGTQTAECISHFRRRRRLVRRQARRLFRRLGLRDYGRFDFRTDAAGRIKLLEVNPNPAWCYDGKLALMAGFGGMDYPALLGTILDTALARSRPATA